MTIHKYYESDDGSDIVTDFVVPHQYIIRIQITNEDYINCVTVRTFVGNSNGMFRDGTKYTNHTAQYPLGYYTEIFELE